MKSKSILWAGVLAIGVGIGIAAGTGAFAPAFAQPSPQPQSCACSVGLNVGTESAPVTIRHCQCGVLTCVVNVTSGRLQCAR